MHLSGKKCLSTSIALLAMVSPFCAHAALSDVASDIQRRVLTGTVVTHSLSVPLAKLGQMLTGAVRVEHLAGNRCRSTLMLTHDQPFERRGVLITSYARRSVQESACPELASHLLAQAQHEADIMAERIGAPLLAAGPPTEAKATLVAVSTAKPVLKSLAPAVPARPLPGARHVQEYIAAAPNATTSNRVLANYRITVTARAVLRDQPSFRGTRAELVAAGYLGLGRSVPGHTGWYEVVIKGRSKPLYIHESVVAQGPVT